MLVADEVTEKPAFPRLPEDNAVGQAGRELRTEGEQELANAARLSVFWATTILLSKIQAQLHSLTALDSNWDSYGAPPPNKIACENAVRILGHMKPFDLALVRIVPCAEGGIGFCFAKGDRYADIESTNDGAIIGVRYIGMQMPILIETDRTDASIEAALKQIRDHIRA